MYPDDYDPNLKPEEHGQSEAPCLTEPETSPEEPKREWDPHTAEGHFQLMVFGGSGSPLDRRTDDNRLHYPRE